MLDLAIVVKSFKLDSHLVERLLSSVERYNVDGIPVFLAVPDDEVTFFEGLSNYDKLAVVAESKLDIPRVTEKIHNFGVGYIEQQLVKLSLHKLELARNYFVLDSDSFFIRQFAYSDFLDNSGRGFTVLTQDKDQFSNPGYTFADNRMKKVNKIADYFSLPSQPRATCHNNAIFLSDALTWFEQWRIEVGLSLIDLMKIAPLEFSWYNFYLQRFHPELIVQVEPLIRMIHNRSEFRSLMQQGMTISALRRSYIGLCINSGWAGRNQNHLVKKFDRGSPFAKTMIRSDQLMYSLHQQLEFYRSDKINKSR